MLVQVDFCAAFDHVGLVFKKRDIDNGDVILNVITCILTGRVQRVLVNGLRSSNAQFSLFLRVVCVVLLLFLL